MLNLQSEIDLMNSLYNMLPQRLRFVRKIEKEKVVTMTAPEFTVNKYRIAPSELISSHFAEFSASIMPCCSRCCSREINCKWENSHWIIAQLLKILYISLVVITYVVLIRAGIFIEIFFRYYWTSVLKNFSVFGNIENSVFNIFGIQ